MAFRYNAAVEISAKCPHCKMRSELKLARGAEPPCPHCHKPLLENCTEAFSTQALLNQCPVCGCAHLYRQKDFNKKLGVALVAVGVVLAFFTYGLSLLLVTLIDWWLYRRVGEVGCCYECGLLIRDTPTLSTLPAFDLELHDYYRSVKPQ